MIIPREAIANLSRDNLAHVSSRGDLLTIDSVAGTFESPLLRGSIVVVIANLRANDIERFGQTRQGQDLLHQLTPHQYQSVSSAQQC